jgi:hypothetical protein
VSHLVDLGLSMPDLSLNKILRAIYIEYIEHIRDYLYVF